MAINLCDIEELLTSASLVQNQTTDCNQPNLKELSMPDDFEKLSDCGMMITDSCSFTGFIYLNLWTEDKLMRIGWDTSEELDLVAEFDFMKSSEVDNCKIFKNNPRFRLQIRSLDLSRRKLLS